MPHPLPLPKHARAGRHLRANPIAAGLPDPRPITGYTVQYNEFGGVSRIIVRLEQPCIIRDPRWGFINCADGSRLEAASVQAAGNDTILFTFAGIIPKSVAFVDVPYQDTQVRNFQGGFVRPGGTWFRSPL